jgi:GTP-binding protein
VHVLLTKCDKLSRSRCARVRQEVGGVTKRFDIPVSIQLFSAVTHVGLDEARRRITEWLD